MFQKITVVRHIEGCIGILQYIRQVTHGSYNSQFKKYKSNTKQTWDTSFKFNLRCSQNQPGYFENISVISPPTHSDFIRGRETFLFYYQKDEDPVIISDSSSCRYFRASLPVLQIQLIGKFHSYYGFSNYAILLFVNKYHNICTVPNCYICK